MRIPLLLALFTLGCRGGPDDTSDALDADGDGVPASEDCNDADATVFPGAEERCDGVDNDCDGEIDEEATDAGTWYADADGDGYGDDAASTTACDAPAGHTAQGGDCDDTRADVNPGAAETDCADPTDYNCDGSVGFADADGDGFAACNDCDDADADVNPDAIEACNGVDDDCDGAIDEAGATGESTFYADADGDGYGDASASVSACTAPAGYVADDTDCDDAADALHPGADEVCNGIDDDCDGAIDEAGAVGESTFYADADADGYGDPETSVSACALPDGYVSDATDCDDTQASTHPGADEICDGVDNDCDGRVPAEEIDGDGDGVSACAGDCDDKDDQSLPGGTEVCDGADNDCDGTIDEEPSDGSTFYADADGDGFGDADAPTIACSQPSGFVTDATDCDDDAGGVNSAAPETCDGEDTDCSGVADDAEAVGEASACAASSCADVLDAWGTAPDGLYFIDPSGSDPFQVYCDQTTEGGGWALVWKNHGGAKGGEKSNASLLSAPGADPVLPYDDALVSQSYGKAMAWYWDQPGREWLKTTSLWDASDVLVDEHQTFRVEMGGVTMKEIFSAPTTNACTKASDTMKVYVTGGKLIGQTDLINSYQAGSATFGLANSGNGGQDACGQTVDNLINDGSDIHRIDGGDGLNAIRHLFSYVHNSAGRDASRCLYACWSADSQGGHYDAFQWGVR